MLRQLCLILFVVCLIGRITDISSLLWAKGKSEIVCDTGACDNEKTEVEKANDDKVLSAHQLHFGRLQETALLKSTFAYTLDINSETYHNLASPPPELS